MKRSIGYGIAVLAVALLPTFSFARDGGYRGGGYRGGGGHWGGGHSYYHGGGHYYGGGWGRSSLGFSFGIYSTPRHYYSDYYYRPVYRSYSYYAPAPYYYDYAPAYDYAPVYVPGPTYVAPVRRYYYDDCRYYYRPSIGFSVSVGGRYHYR